MHGLHRDAVFTRVASPLLLLGRCSSRCLLFSAPLGLPFCEWHFLERILFLRTRLCDIIDRDGEGGGGSWWWDIGSRTNSLGHHLLSGAGCTRNIWLLLGNCSSFRLLLGLLTLVAESSQIQLALLLITLELLVPSLLNFFRRAVPRICGWLWRLNWRRAWLRARIAVEGLGPFCARCGILTSLCPCRLVTPHTAEDIFNTGLAELHGWARILRILACRPSLA